MSLHVLLQSARHMRVLSSAFRTWRTKRPRPTSSATLSVALAKMQSMPLSLASNPLNPMAPSLHEKANNSWNIHIMSILTQKFSKWFKIKNLVWYLPRIFTTTACILSSGSLKAANQQTSSMIMNYVIYWLLANQALNCPQTKPSHEISMHPMRSVASVSPNYFRNTLVIYISQQTLGLLQITMHL